MRTRGYTGSQNVFSSGYKTPIVGHWVPIDEKGHAKWMSGKDYVKQYGNDDPTGGTFLGHSQKEISQAPSL